MLELAPGERGVQKRLPIGDVGALTSFFEVRSLKKHCPVFQINSGCGKSITYP